MRKKSGNNASGRQRIAKAEKCSRNVRKRYEYGIKMPVSFFRAVKIRCGFSGGSPIIGLTAFVLRLLLDVDIHTHYALYGLQNAFILLDGVHAVLLHEKKTDSLLSVPLRCLCLRRSVSLRKNKEMLGC